MMNGTIIGNRYEIVETIGKGGMAIVYKAKCLVLNRYVALKVLRPEFREDKEFINRFKVEAQSAGRLSQSNIVSIYDVCQEDDLDYIVMEYVEGVTLKQYLEAKGAIPWREAVDYAAQICAGLDHAHRNGIIHKDIKPHNIMITREGTLKITDFGIAKVMSSSTISTGNVATMGSVHYFSPEQARGGYTDHKTDIYSLGVVLYEMVTGKLPFQGDTAIAIAMQHIEKTPEAPTELNPDVPKSLENVIFRAMCKEQSLRYDSVTQMLVDLKKVYTGNMVDYSDLASGATTITPIISDGKGKNVPDDLLGTKRKKKVNKKDLIGVIAGSVTGLLLVALLFLFGFHLAGGGGSGKLELPDFTNKTVEEAEAMVVNSNLQIVIDKEEKSETVASGKIISQEPKAGEKVKEDATVKVVVSAGGTDFPMPDLVNRHESDAQNILKEKKLNFSIVPEPSETIPEEYVVRQEPVSGTYVDAATTVVIYVSAGKEDATVEVPNLLGLTEEEAKAELLDAGLTWGKIEEMESTKAKGTVISQSIRAKVEVKEQTSIDLRISSGKKDAEATKTPKPTSQPATNPTTPPIVIAPPNAG
ncbi:MAG: Stk1 family PASTA domain-containing Ser/Thr kinase [Clostridia bacterium]|nr:Stk1 family PASTA domain-containing Ser/Thr kinase [Clostridia bacterium]